MTEQSKKRTRAFVHWGTFEVETDAGRITAVHGFAGDADPSPIGQSLADANDAGVRIDRPMVRQGWLENGPQMGTPAPNGRRGAEPFVAVSWDQATELVASELTRVADAHGNQAIFGEAAYQTMPN